MDVRNKAKRCVRWRWGMAKVKHADPTNRREGGATVTVRSGLAADARSFVSNPSDGHVLGS